MNIVKSDQSPLTLALLGNGGRIEIGYEDYDKAVAILDKIDVDVILEPIFYREKKMVSLSPARQSDAYMHDTLPRELRDKAKEYKPEVIMIPDFRNSEAFYNKCERSQLKIISDQYSEQRAKLLYERISNIEANLRGSYIEQYGLNDLTAPSSYRSKKQPDHKITHFDLNEMMNLELLKPASDDHFLERIKGAQSDADILKARELKRIDEMELPITQAEYKEFQKVRNAVMHFRVVRASHVKETLTIAQKFGQYTFDTMVKSISKLRVDGEL